MQIFSNSLGQTVVKGKYLREAVKYSFVKLREKTRWNQLITKMLEHCAQVTLGEVEETRTDVKSRLSLIVRVNVVLNRTVVVDSD